MDHFIASRFHSLRSIVADTRSVYTCLTQTKEKIINANETGPVTTAWRCRCTERVRQTRMHRGIKQKFHQCIKDALTTRASDSQIDAQTFN